MSEFRRKLGTLWVRKFRADMTAGGEPSGTDGLGNGALGTMPLGGE